MSGDLPYQGQAQTTSDVLLGRSGPEKRFEDALAIGLVDPRAGVGDMQVQGFAVDAQAN